MSDVEDRPTPSPEEPTQQPSPDKEQPTEADQELDDSYIKLKVRSQDGKETVFRIKRSTPLRKLMDTYCKRGGYTESSLRFLIDGERVQAHQTADDLHLEDDQIIDALFYQLGGSF
ncbi:hypothetical protein GEMRC1_006500 [Eukaryota sp. GEM-RC1]